ncbi:MAG: hypothetical protein FJ091_08875 [Deltaproteobacteria bacterium]|nr:hypothetical protein [Deltaproteobacteria bacterium]
MSAPTWQAFYNAGWQFPFAVMVVPFAFLLYRAIARERREDALDPALAPFVSLWVTLFTLETLLDPVATGPFAKWLGAQFTAAGLHPNLAGNLLGTTFVVLGDFRVFWLVLRFRTPEQTTRRAALEAAALSTIAPVLAGLVSLSGVPAQAMWLTHELISLVLAFALARLALPNAATHPHHAQFVRRVLGYMAAYYGLWAAADVIILAGYDTGWPVRLVPNQLYYGFFVPFVWRGFFRAS